MIKTMEHKKFFFLSAAVLAAACLFFLAANAFATVILDPNDPNFTGYPDGNAAFNAQCSDLGDSFYVYFSKSDTQPQDTSGAVGCTDYSHWYNWQAFYDQFAGQGTSYLLEVVPGADCTLLSYSVCFSTYGYVEPTPTPTATPTPTPTPTPGPTPLGQEYYQALYNGTTTDFYFSNVWSAPDIVIILLLGFLCFCEVIRGIVGILTRRKVGIFKKYTKI